MNVALHAGAVMPQTVAAAASAQGQVPCDISHAHSSVVELLACNSHHMEGQAVFLDPAVCSALYEKDDAPVAGQKPASL